MIMPFLNGSYRYVEHVGASRAIELTVQLSPEQLCRLFDWLAAQSGDVPRSSILGGEARGGPVRF